MMGQNDGTGKLFSMVDFAGRTTKFDVQAGTNNLRFIERPEVMNETGVPVMPTKQFGYTAPGLLTEIAWRPTTGASLA